MFVTKKVQHGFSLDNWTDMFTCKNFDCFFNIFFKCNFSQWPKTLYHTKVDEKQNNTWRHICQSQIWIVIAQFFENCFICQRFGHVTIIAIDIGGIDCWLGSADVSKIKYSRWRLNWAKGQATAMEKAILGVYFWKLMLRINRNRQYIPE